MGIRYHVAPDVAGGDKFTLADGAGGDGEGEELTHMGRSLADDIRNLMDVSVCACVCQWGGGGAVGGARGLRGVDG